MKALHYRSTTIFIITVIAILLVVGGIFLRQRAVKQPADSSQTVQSAGFSLLLKPGELSFSSGKEEIKTAVISVDPLNGFNDPVNVKIQYIAFQDSNEDMSAPGIRAVIAPATASPGMLSASEYAQGVPLLVSHDGTAKKGNYILLLEATVKAETKTFLLPISVK